MSISYWQDSSKEKKLQADIIVIGGGIAGHSAVYWLKKEDPSLEIVVLEKSFRGGGATGRNAGFITCGSVEHFNRLVTKHGEQEAHEIWQFSEENLRLLKQEIIKERGDEIYFEQKGSFSLASTQEEFNELKKSAALMEKLDITVETIDEKQIRERLGASKFVGGIKYCDDASVHPMKLIELMQEQAAKLGKVSWYENQEVHGIESAGDHKLVKTQNFSVEAPIVVMATNGYSALLDDYFKDKIFPTRGQILCTEKLPKFMEGPCYANFVLDYFRQLPTGEMIIGGFRQLQKDTEMGYSDETTDVIQSALEKFLRDHLSSLKDAKITHRWSGIMGFSADGQPLVGALSHDPQIFFLGGFTAHGLGLAFHCGKVLADCLFDRPVPRFISAKRF